MPLLVVVVQILQVEMPRLLTVFLCEPHALELVGLVLRLLLEAARPRRKLVLFLAALAPSVERHLAHLKIGIHSFHCNSDQIPTQRDKCLKFLSSFFSFYPR